MDLPRAIELAKGLEEADAQSKIIPSEQQQTLTEENAHKIAFKKRTPAPRKTAKQVTTKKMLPM